MDTVVIFGAQGMLGSDIFRIFSAKKNLTVFPLARFNYDVRFSEDIKAALEKHRPDVIINCTSFTDVDAAEQEKNESEVFTINAGVPMEMARQAKIFGAKFVHFSTDYVFDGTENPYTERSRTNPLNMYGESKMDGEMEIWAQNEDALVFRVSRLFGHARDNFVSRVAGLAKKNKPISAFDDEYGNFTFTEDIAYFLLDFLETHENESGTYHLCGGECVSPYEVAKKIVEIRTSQSEVIPVSASSVSRIAKRPQKVEMKSEKIPPLPGVSTSLIRYFKKRED